MSRKRPPTDFPAKNGHSVVFRPPRNRLNLTKLQFDVVEQPDPEKVNTNEMSSIDYVKSYLSNKLILPPDYREHQLVFDELIDIECLGSGSFGVVRKMEHSPTKINMAVKRIRITNNGTEDALSKSMQRFRQEIEATKAASNCEEIVKYFGITFHDGDAWMCMELMDLSLDKLYMISHGIAFVDFQEEALGAVAVATIHALEHLKTNHHIIHRDIKPSNILLDRNGSVKLCDFGICGYLQNSVAQSVDVGCRPYMAPERIMPNGKGYDVKSDVWSLGISMVEVANGKYPYQGFMEAPILEQVNMIVWGDPPLLLNDLKLSLSMKAFITACIVKDSEVRADFNYLKQTEVYKTYIKDDHRPIVGDFVFQMYQLRHQLPFPNYHNT